MKIKMMVASRDLPLPQNQALDLAKSFLKTRPVKGGFG